MDDPPTDCSNIARTKTWIIVLASCAVLGCHPSEHDGATQVNSLAKPVSAPTGTAPAAPKSGPANITVPDAASPPEDGQWTMPARDYANTRFSGLDEINASNVGKLQLAFTFATGTLLGQNQRYSQWATRCTSSLRIQTFCMRWT